MGHSAAMPYQEYKVISVSEGVLGTLFLGSSKIPTERMEQALNEHARTGWQVVFQVVESKRLLLFWQRETVIITLGR